MSAMLNFARLRNLLMAATCFMGTYVIRTYRPASSPLLKNFSMLPGVNPMEAFQATLKRLGKTRGAMSRIAEASDIPLTRLSNYKKGEPVDVQISTFAAIVKAAGISADEALGLSPPDPARAASLQNRASVERAAKNQRKLEKALEIVSEVRRSLEEPKNETPQP